MAAVNACAEMCGGKTEGLYVGSREFTFTPGGRINGGTFSWDIGTAGSTTMMAFGILPLACFAEGPVVIRIGGGVFQDFAPSPHHMHHVLGGLVRRMGLSIQLDVVRAGYVPRGAGVIELNVTPVNDRLRSLSLVEQGSVAKVSGVAFSSHLEQRRVSDRMAEVCERRFSDYGLVAEIDRVYDRAALHAGACLAVWSESSTGCIFGADRAGALRRSSEAIGRYVAETFIEDLDSGATVDRHAADQLVLYAALAGGASRYVAPRVTAHLESNLWLAERFGAKFDLDGRRVTVHGIGFHR
jgi:RNA 3'-terminal phosphate cyclase (ATP)